MSTSTKLKKGDAVRHRGETFIVRGTIEPIVPDPRIEGHTLAQLQSLDRIHFATICTEDLSPSELTAPEIVKLSKLRDERAVLERPAHELRVRRKSLARLRRRFAETPKADKLKREALAGRIALAQDELDAEVGDA